ncbi:MAG: hypothetical protein ACJ8EK_10665, partial [Bradyrhizobium sp.]
CAWIARLRNLEAQSLTQCTRREEIEFAVIVGILIDGSCAVSGVNPRKRPPPPRIWLELPPIYASYFGDREFGL